MDTCFYQIVDSNMCTHGRLFTSKIMATEAIKSIMSLNENTPSFYTIHRVNPSKCLHAHKVFEIAVTWDDIQTIWMMTASSTTDTPLDAL